MNRSRECRADRKNFINALNEPEPKSINKSWPATTTTTTTTISRGLVVWNKERMLNSPQSALRREKIEHRERALWTQRKSSRRVAKNATAAVSFSETERHKMPTTLPSCRTGENVHKYTERENRLGMITGHSDDEDVVEGERKGRLRGKPPLNDHQDHKTSSTPSSSFSCILPG